MDTTERRLWVDRVPKEALAEALAGEGAAILDVNTDGAPGREGWILVDHTFAVQEDGSALLTMFFERTIDPNQGGNLVSERDCSRKVREYPSVLDVS